MTAQSGDLGRARSAPWPLLHPGLVALVSSVVTCVGLVAVVVGLTERSGLAQAGMLGEFWNTALVLVGAAMFVGALPTALGFAGASCATQRELWPGVLGGFVAVLVTLAVVGLVLPVQGAA
ncbi:MAG TPA: hypothetical protein VGC04_06505 [Cellulomonas sp.]